TRASAQARHRAARTSARRHERSRTGRLDHGGQRAFEPRRDANEALIGAKREEFSMHPQLDRLQLQTRRHFLKTCQLGVAAAALSALLANDPQAESQVENPLGPKKPHFPAKAKRVIYLHLTGSPPHLDLYDYKPELVKHDGQPCPEVFTKGKRFAFTSGTPKLLGTPR